MSRRELKRQPAPVVFGGGLVVWLADEALGVVQQRARLPRRGAARLGAHDDALAVGCDEEHRRRDRRARAVWNHVDLAIFKDGNAAKRRAEVNTDGSCRWIGKHLLDRRSQENGQKTDEDENLV
mmetsp:Transcript_23935/g.52331  ORF Transcript_23935/g.52331 Transcript_23935/m.52331 type:complete len:124 (+) Transcript_23935:1192-1563(+)